MVKGQNKIFWGIPKLQQNISEEQRKYVPERMKNTGCQEKQKKKHSKKIILFNYFQFELFEKRRRKNKNNILKNLTFNISNPRLKSLYQKHNISSTKSIKLIPHSEKEIYTFKNH